jgi:hypothetical protein
VITNSGLPYTPSLVSDTEKYMRGYRFKNDDVELEDMIDKDTDVCGQLRGKLVLLHDQCHFIKYVEK